MIPNELKQDLNRWFDKRIKEWGNLKNLHYALLGMKKDDWPEWKMMIDDIIFTYNDIADTLIEGEGEIRCMPREIKQDIVPFLRRKASDYPEDISRQIIILADTIQNKVPICTARGTPSGSWLKRRGYTRQDLIKKDNITQVGKKSYHGLEME